MSEAAMWARVRDVMKDYWRAERVENALSAGFPDVVYTTRRRDGLLELKQIADWPATPRAAVRVPHFTTTQRAWHRLWGAAGGQSFVLLHVERADDWLLFRGATAARALGLCSRTATRGAAVWIGDGGIRDPARLAFALSSGP